VVEVAISEDTRLPPFHVIAVVNCKPSWTCIRRIRFYKDIEQLLNTCHM